MSIHSHKFVETYEGLVGFGADRETDENTVVYYLQKFSDDRLMKTIIKRLRPALRIIVSGRASPKGRCPGDRCRSSYRYIQTIRIGTKALTFWPHRFVTDEDADELIDLLHKDAKVI